MIPAAAAPPFQAARVIRTNESREATQWRILAKLFVAKVGGACFLYRHAIPAVVSGGSGSAQLRLKCLLSWMSLLILSFCVIRDGEKKRV